MSRLDRVARRACRQVIEMLEQRMLLSVGAGNVGEELAPAVITVNTFVDQIDDPASGIVSLRDAVAQAATMAGSVAVEAPAGEYDLTLGELAVSSTSGDITIQAISGTANLIAKYSGRVVHVELGADVAISGFNIENGDLNTDTGYEYGEGILNEGTLTLINSTVQGCRDGLTSAEGGGIYNAGTMMVDNCVVSQNFITGLSGDVKVGGGIYNAGTMTLTDSTISGNRARNGGGVANSGVLNVNGCTISGNVSYYDGGGVDNVSGGELTISNSTIAKNVAYRDGGGITNGSDALLVNCTIADNWVYPWTSKPTLGGGGVFNSGNFTVGNSIVFDNLSIDDSGEGPDMDGAFLSEGHNIVGEGDNSTGWNGDDFVGSIALPMDPKLSLFGNQGGPTQTFVPLPGSPAIDAGSNALAPAGDLDQRGLARIVNGTIDIGAVEAQASNAYIAGTVFADRNGNGVRDLTHPGISSSLESGISAVTVYSDTNNNGILDAGEPTQITDDNGDYMFAGLAAGNYKIREILPAGIRQTTPTKGFGWTISLAASQGGTNKDFGRLNGRIGGIVIFDVNGDGMGDGGFPITVPTGITIYIDSNNDGKLDNGEQSMLATPELGEAEFGFNGLVDGTYKVREILPDGWTQTYPDNNFGLNLGVAAGLVEGGSFGVAPTSEVVIDASISGTIFDDVNGNGALDGGELGRGGITVYNDANNNGKMDAGEAATSTDENGDYTLSGLTSGNYKIREQVPSGWQQTSPSNNFGWTLTLASHATVTDKNFGERVVAAVGGSISGSVFNDVDGNGKQSSGELGLSAWTLYIDTNNDGLLDDGERSVHTKSDGTYSLSGLGAGTYIVRVIRPTGWSQTTPSNGFGQRVTLAANQIKGGAVFGERRSV